MLFNSFEFLVFLPVVFTLYWFVFKGRKPQNLLIVLTSYIFYGWWDWRFLILIAFTSLCSFFSGKLIGKNGQNPKKQHFISAANIIINLLVLGVFKYYNFFAESCADFLKLFGFEADFVTLNVILPVGISFYTFQALSYSIDVYKGKIKPTDDIIEFFAYISFFPQLVAGPIERATNLLPQFQKDRNFEYSKAVDGCRQMLWGFFKKMVVADNCAAIVNQHWNEYQGLPTATLLLLGVMFAFQIYCDFSGYSDIAIGCARLFGFELKQNFNFPYFSRSIPEFWRRWHISLTTWFRDYIYFPLGGSRCSKAKIIRNVFIVWAVSGLWHGANWTFVCWGLFHAMLLAIYNIFEINTKYKDTVKLNVKSICQITLTFILAVIGWIIFRAENIGQATAYLSAMFSNQLINFSMLYGKKALILIGILVVAEWLQRDKAHVLQLPENKIFRHAIVRWVVYYALILTITTLGDSNQTFIYFQF